VGDQLTIANAERSSDELRDFPGWKVGRETRVYRVGDTRVHVHVTGWASEETIRKHEAGDASVWPTFFFEAIQHYGNGAFPRNVAGGLITAAELERYASEYYSTSGAETAMGVALGKVEACL
jgi:hypothetical protein